MICRANQLTGFYMIATLAFNELKERCMVFKPDNGQGIMLLQKKDYYDSLEQLFNDPTKFEILNEDPTLFNFSTIQRYLNTLELRGEITTEENKQ